MQSSANRFWQMRDPHLGRHAIAYVCKAMQGAHTGRVGLGQNRWKATLPEICLSKLWAKCAQALYSVIQVAQPWSLYYLCLSLVKNWDDYLRISSLSCAQQFAIAVLVLSTDLVRSLNCATGAPYAVLPAVTVHMLAASQVILQQTSIWKVAFAMTCCIVAGMLVIACSLKPSSDCSTVDLLEKLIVIFLVLKQHACVIIKRLPAFDAWQDNLLVHDMTNSVQVVCCATCVQYVRNHVSTDTTVILPNDERRGWSNNLNNWARVRTHCAFKLAQQHNLVKLHLGSVPMYAWGILHNFNGLGSLDYCLQKGFGTL